MQDMTIGQFVTLLTNATSYTLLAVFIFGAMTGHVVFKREVEKNDLRNDAHKAELLRAKDEIIADLRRQLEAQERETAEYKGFLDKALHITGRSTDNMAAALSSTPSTG